MLELDAVDLDHDAVDLVGGVVAVLAVEVDEGVDAFEVVDDPVEVADRQAERAEPFVDLRLGAGRGGPSHLPIPWTIMCNGRCAVMRGSFCRREPAAELRGLANGALPASTSCSLSFLNSSTGM